MSAETVEHDLDAAPEPQPDSRSRVRLRPALGVAAVVAAVAAGVAVWLASGEDGGESSADAAPAATTEVIRESIADTRTFGGTLGNGEPVPITATGQGVVTGLAEQGTEATRGTELYRIDEQPVTAMRGELPMYRDLSEGMSGPDVEQLVSNLTELGHADCGDTDEFTWCVAEAVEAWQDEIGADETGVVARSDVVFVPAGTQIGTVHTRVGATVAPGADVLDLTSTEQVVSAEVEVRDRELLPVGAEVSVTLPGDVEVPGTVSEASVVAVESGSGAGGDETGPDDTITEVEVTLGEEVDEALLGSPADVVIEVDERTDVLTVPVTALLALSEGGHGVEIVHDDGTTEIVPVETGLFANGRVEVDGDGVEAGTVVGVAGR